jgi:hypothetical protein
MAVQGSYWADVGAGHHIDLHRIRSYCFRLLCMVEASQGILHNIDAIAAERKDEGEGLAEGDLLLVNLHDEMIVEESSKALLQLAIMLRVYDDQMKGGEHSAGYLAHLAKDGNDGDGSIGSTDDQKRFNYRDACNKIIHASKLTFIRERFERQFDDEDFDFESLTGELEIMGTNGQTKWNAVLWIQPFVETVIGILSFGYPSSARP